MKLTERVYLVGGGAFGYSDASDCNIYLVDCGSGLAVVDTGGGKGVSKVLENIQRMGFNPQDVEVAFNTHCHYDHIVGNRDLKEATGCKIAAHEAEIEEIESLGKISLYEMAKQAGLEFEATKVDIKLSGDQTLIVGELSFEVIHTPGHSPGGVCLLIGEENASTIFTGDTASAQGRLGWINGPGCDIKKWKQSIRKLLKLKPNRLFPGHNVFTLENGVEKLQLLNEKMNSPWINIVTSIG